MITPLHRRHFRAAFTLAELMMSVALSSVILGAIIVASVTVQKSIQASQDYTTGMAAQVRVLDYIGLDVRRAITVTSTGNHSFDLQIPDYYDTSKSSPVPRQPTLPPTAKMGTSSVPLYYGTGTITVSYSQQGTNIIRSYNGTQTVLVSNVASIDMEANTKDPNVTVTISFIPTFHHGTAVDDSTKKVTTMTTSILMRNSQKINLQ